MTPAERQDEWVVSLPALAPEDPIPVPVLLYAVKVLTAAHADLATRMAEGRLVPVAERFEPMRRTLEGLASWIEQAERTHDAEALRIARHVDLLTHHYLHTLAEMDAKVRQLRDRIDREFAAIVATTLPSSISRPDRMLSREEMLALPMPKLSRMEIDALDRRFRADREDE